MVHATNPVALSEYAETKVRRFSVTHLKGRDVAYGVKLGYTLGEYLMWHTNAVQEETVTAQSNDGDYVDKSPELLQQSII